MLGLADRSVDFGHLEGGRDETFRPPRCALSCSDSSGGQGYKKERLDGCLLRITLPVAVGLGGNAAGRIKCTGSRTHVRRRAASLRSRPADSYELVSVFKGHRSVEPQLIRTTLFPCLRPWSLSCFDDHVCDRGASSRGASIYVRVLSLYALVRVPLTDILDNKLRRYYYYILFGQVKYLYHGV